MKQRIFPVGFLLIGIFLLSGCTKVEVPQMEITYAVGQPRGGGIVGYVDESGEHGLITTEYDIDKSANWAEAQTLCTDYAANGYTDWQLPTKNDLELLYAGAQNNTGITYTSTLYWSSTEASATQVYTKSFGTGTNFTTSKTTSIYNVRPVRSF